MTAPYDINEVIPSKAKAWVGLLGSLLTICVPWVLQFSDSLPAPWPGVVGLVLAVLTALGIYKAPYKPTDETVLVHKAQVSAPDLPLVTPQNPAAPEGYQNPWQG